MKTIAIIQARMGSSRLPGKVLEDLAGEPVLTRVVNRVGRARTLDSVVIATTENKSDDVIVDLCKTKDWPFFRGSEDDVLDRYYQAALAFGADVIVRITSDCPLIESDIIDKVVSELMSHYGDVEYVNNGLKRSYPRGLDVEAMSFTALKTAWEEDPNPAWREHVTPYIWNNPEKFRIRVVVNETDYSYMRWTLDTIEDLIFIRQIYEHFQNDTFFWDDVLEVLKIHPEWLKINQHIKQKTVL